MEYLTVTLTVKNTIPPLSQLTHGGPAAGESAKLPTLFNQDNLIT